METEINKDQFYKIINSMGVSLSNLEEIYPRIMEPLAKPSELNFTAREFFYWCDKGIIDIQKSEEGQSPWSRLNLLDVIWIRIVKGIKKIQLSVSFHRKN